jgi:hypothetical protein
MIQLCPNGFEGIGDVRVIHHPAKLRVAFSGDNYFDAKTVAVEAPTFV